MSKKRCIEHESFGMISIHRVQSRGTPLFGSSLIQQNLISIKVTRADDTRHLNKHWYHPKEILVEFDLSPTQFIDAMTNMNTTGVPCTLRNVGGERMEECPHEDVFDTFHSELKEDIKEVLGRTGKLMKLVEEKLKAPGTISKATRLELAEHLYHIEQDIRANLPFVYKQFNRQMDKSVSEAKGEIEAFFTQTIHNLGSKELVRLLDAGELQHPLLGGPDDLD